MNVTGKFWGNNLHIFIDAQLFASFHNLSVCVYSSSHIVPFCSKMKCI